MSKVKADRNEQLIKDYLAKRTNGKYKFNFVDLVSKYRINSARIVYILNRAGVKRG